MSRVELVGRSAQHLTLLSTLSKIAPTLAEVLLLGPTGVGKERYARFLHERSGRPGSFVALNCGAVPIELLENELFGHVSGAFTGARLQREGLVDEAQGGTLFLDEVDALHPSNQVKLLRFLQEKEYRRLGESKERRADLRIVSASNADLVEAVRAGRFRADLFFRLYVVPIRVPALHERPEDVRPLVEAFVAHYAAAYGLPPVVFSEEALRRMELHPWPGNARELESCIRYLTCIQLCRPVRPEDLPFHPSATPAPPPGPPGPVLTDLPFQRAKQRVVSDFERLYLSEVLRRHGGNVSRAARASGKPRRAFFELMRKHRLDAASFRFELEAQERGDGEAPPCEAPAYPP